MPPEQFSAEFQLLLDEAKKNKVVSGIGDIEKELIKSGTYVDALTLDFELFNKTFNKTHANVSGKLVDITKKAKAASEAFSAFPNRVSPQLQYKAFSSMSAELKNRQEARVLSAQQLADAKALVNVLAKQNTEWSRIRGAASNVQQISRSLVLIGGGVVGGAFAGAQKYINDAEESTALTRQWKAATDDLNKSSSRVGAVLAQEALPLLQKVVRLADQASDFVEKNPQIIQAALNTGVILAGIGAIGYAVSSGIKLVADAGYIATVATQLLAARQMQEAANKQLAAGGIMGKGAIGNAAGGLKGLAGGLTGVGASSLIAIASSVAAAILGGLVVGGFIADMMEREQGRSLAGDTTGGAFLLGKNVFGPIAKMLDGIDEGEVERKSLVFAALIGKLTGAIDENSPLWIKAANSVKDASQIIQDATDSLQGSIHEEEIVKAFTDMQEDLKKLEEDYGDKRADIMERSNERLLDLAKSNAENIANINQRYKDRISDITKDIRKTEQKAERDNSIQRAKIIRDGNLDIQRMEEDHLRRLAEIQRDHDNNVFNLVLKRDALGLVLEQRAFDEKVNREEADTNLEISRRRQDLAIRLQDLQAAAIEERKQRLENLQQQLRDAGEQRARELAEQRRAYHDQLAQAREAKARELREAAQVYQRAQADRRAAFIAQVRDLDASLLGERGLKQRYYNAMLSDAEKFLANYRNALSGARPKKIEKGASDPTNPYSGADMGHAPIHDYSGYAYSGLYQMAANGQRQFVLSGSATRAAENILGQRLTQGNLLNNVSQSKKVQYTDNRRFSSQISAADRRAIQGDTLHTLEEVLK